MSAKTRTIIGDLGEDSFDFIGRTSRPAPLAADVTAAPEPVAVVAAEDPLRQLSVRVPVTLHRRFKSAVTASGETLQDVMTGMIESYLRDRGGR